MKKNEIGTWILYVACVIALVWAPSGVASIAGWVLGGTLVIHLIEFFVKREVMAKAGGSMGEHFLRTLLYGFFHWKPLEDEQKAGS